MSRRPLGKKDIPGHKRAVVEGLAACECGWQAEAPTLAASNRERGQHLVDVRMDLLDQS